MHMDDRGRLGGEQQHPVSGLADFDEADYRPYLTGADFNDAQARELLLVLWEIARMCIEVDVSSESWGQITSSIFADAADDPAGIR